MPDAVQDIADQLGKIDILSTNSAVGIALAVVAAVGLAFGTQFQHRGVELVGKKTGGRGKTGLSLGQLRSLLARPSWVVGTLLLALAVVLQLTSITFAPLIVVQPLGAIALVITALVNARVTKTPLDRTSIRSIIVSVSGVGVFVTVAAIVARKHPIEATQLATVLIILSVVLAGLVTSFILMRRHTPKPIFYVVAAGVLFGFVVTLANVVIGRVQTLLVPGHKIDSADILTILCIIGLVVAGLLGSYFVQTAHSSNPPDLVVAGLTVIDPLVAVAIGIVVLNEAGGAPWWAVVIFVVAAAAAVWGVVTLSRHHPQSLANTALADAVEKSAEQP